MRQVYQVAGVPQVLRLFNALVTQQYERKKRRKVGTHSDTTDPWVQAYLPRHSYRGPLQGGPIARGPPVATLGRGHNHGDIGPSGSL